MNKLLALLLMAVALALFKAVVVTLSITLALTLVYAFVRRPREMLLLIGSLAILCLVLARPTASLATIGFIGVAVAAAGVRRTPPRQLLPPGNSGSH